MSPYPLRPRPDLDIRRIHNRADAARRFVRLACIAAALFLLATWLMPA